MNSLKRLLRNPVTPQHVIPNPSATRVRDLRNLAQCHCQEILRAKRRALDDVAGELQNPISLGFIFFSLQLFLILLICPEKTWSSAWLSLAAHWDSEWYEAIAQYGYINTDFPLRSGLRSANVVFFPGYPYLARGLILLFGINAKVALLAVAQTAALLFWCLFFYILKDIKCSQKLIAGLLIALFPSSWFMFMGYSESLFLLCCCFMLWTATQQKWVLSGFSAFYMTGTRLVGLPVLVAPFLATLIAHSLTFKSEFKNKTIAFVLEAYTPLCLIFLVGTLGCLGFLFYCNVEFGSWSVYFDMERLFWRGTADPGFLFKSVTWLPPPFGYEAAYAPPLPNAYGPLFIFNFFRLASYSLSQTLVPLFLWTLIGYSIWIIKNREKIDQTSLIWFLAAVFLFLLTCFSLSTRFYESMNRCLFPVWVLLIISDVIYPNKVFFFRIKNVKFSVFLLVSFVFISGGFWLQLLNRYFLGWWVA